MKIFLRALLWASILVFAYEIAKADPLKVAVIDTGLDIKDQRLSSHICPTGHKDFTGTGLTDHFGHGTHVVGLIEKYAGSSDYCIIVLKYTDNEVGHMANYIKGLKEAVAQKADVVNLSVSGENFSEEERALICAHHEITFVVAAGNDDRDLDVNPMYPASLGCSNIIVVGSRDYLRSNYGTMVHSFEQGLNVESTLPNGKTGQLTGTSQASAIQSGKVVYEKSRR